MFTSALHGVSPSRPSSRAPQRLMSTWLVVTQATRMMIANVSTMVDIFWGQTQLTNTSICRYISQVMHHCACCASSTVLYNIIADKMCLILYPHMQPEIYAEEKEGELLTAVMPPPFQDCTPEASLTGCLFKFDSPQEQCKGNRTGDLCSCFCQYSS